MGARSEGGVTEPIGSEGVVTVPLPLLHALVNHPARMIGVNTHPETRIVLLRGGRRWHAVSELLLLVEFTRNIPSRDLRQ